MPIRLRIALVVAAGLAVLLVASGYAFLHQLRGSLTASIDTGLWSQRRALLSSLDEHLKPNLLDGTQLLSAAGRVVAESSDDTGSGPLIDRRVQAEARARPVWLDTSANIEGYPARVLAFALPAGGPATVAVVSSSMELLDVAVTHVEEGFLFGGPVVVAGGALAGWLLAGASLRPVERMRRQAESFTADGAGQQLDVPGTRDELAALAATMNRLLGRLRMAVERERSFVADAGHELRTPLAILRTELELAARPQRTHAELAEAVQAAGQETERIARLAEALLLLARGSDQWLLRREPVAVQPLLEGLVVGITAGAIERRPNIALRVAPTELTATWDEARIRQIVWNLLDNAIRYSPAGEPIELSACGFPGRVVITVRDRGAGFPEAFLPHAFERFSRADPARHSAAGGAGLGLSIVSMIAVAHGGQARARNDPAGGAVVEVELPEPAPNAPGGR